ncbi:hypothetical protein WG907_11765 [Sphingobium sp. AN558]|uniref:hypothetical protein n=1 Tax=Sphingobium sp. AN558 TaxID=3133442 RepID=UPI0030BD8D20
MNELYLRESVGATVDKKYEGAIVRAAIGSLMWSARDEILMPFESQAIQKNFPLSFGALNGCIEGSLAAPFCRGILRDKMVAEYELARPRLKAALQGLVNRAELAACKIITANGPLTRQLLSQTPSIGD